jgi:hypothetical protein
MTQGELTRRGRLAPRAHAGAAGRRSDPPRPRWELRDPVEAPRRHDQPVEVPCDAQTRVADPWLVDIEARVLTAESNGSIYRDVTVHIPSTFRKRVCFRSKCQKPFVTRRPGPALDRTGNLIASRSATGAVQLRNSNLDSTGTNTGVNASAPPPACCGNPSRFSSTSKPRRRDVDLPAVLRLAVAPMRRGTPETEIILLRLQEVPMRICVWSVICDRSISSHSSRVRCSEMEVW